nr:hypothetical protein BaRGS_034173 [Batillaria attramentaria]
MLSGPKPVLSKVRMQKDIGSLHIGGPTQALLLQLFRHWGQEGFVNHMDQLAEFYKTKAQTAAKYARKHLADLADWNPPKGGLFLWIRFHGVKDTGDIVAEALRRGLVVTSGRHFNPSNQDSPYIRVNYAVASEEELDKARVNVKFVNYGAAIALVAFGILIFLSGVLGNGFLLLVLATQRKLWEVHNIFIANLALADLVVICTGLPFVLLDLLLGYQPVVNHLHCEVNGFILSLAYSASILSLISVSFNRYMKVCHTNRFRTLFTAKKTVLYCFLLWVTGCLMQVPLLAGYPKFGYDAGAHGCQGRSVRKQVNYGGIVMSTALVGSVFLIGYFNYAIFRKWNQSRSKVRGQIKTKRDEQPKATPTLGQQGEVEFTILNEISPESQEPKKTKAGSPETTISHFSEEKSYADYGTDVPSEIVVFAALLLYVNCAINWVIYGAMNISFKQGYVETLRCLKSRVNGFVLCLAYSVSILSLVSISFNRYMKVCHYNLFPKLFSVRKNALFCVGLWALGCVLQTPLLAGYPSYGYDAGAHCCQARSVRKEINYGGMAMSVLLAGPVVMIGYFNYSIFHTWNQSRSKFKGKEKRKEDGEVEAKPSLHGKLKSVFYVEISDSDISSDMPRSTNVTGASAETEMADYTVDKPSAIFASGVQERSASNDRSLPAEADADNTLYTRDFTARLQIEPDITPACSVSNLAANTSSDKIIFSPDPAKEKSKVKSPEMESSEKGAKKKKHHTTTRAEVALVRSLLVISICLLVLYTPFAVCLLTDYGTDVSSEVMVFVSLLLFVNCAVNWVIYGAMNTSFRQGAERER